MNKKILSIFALIMALSFAVSCSNNSTNSGNDGNGGGNTGGNTKLELADIETALKTAIGKFLVNSTDAETEKADFSAVSLSGTKLSTTVSGNTANGNLQTATDNLNNNITTAKTTLDGAHIELGAASKFSASGAVATTTVTISAQSGYSLPDELAGGSITIEITLAGSGKTTWE